MITAEAADKTNGMAAADITSKEAAETTTAVVVAVSSNSKRNATNYSVINSWGYSGN